MSEDTNKSCVKETVITVLTKADTEACGFKFTPSCGHTKLPDGDFNIGIGEPCPSEPCPTCAVLDGEVISEPCTIVGKLGDSEDVGCDWLPTVCIPSIPPATACAPIFGGEGGYDGGVAEWTGNCLEDCDLAILKAQRGTFETYIQGNWEHVLDLATNPELTTQLLVNHEGNQRPINTQEWHALGYKLTRSAIRAGALNEFANESNIGLAYVDMGGDTYGLTATINGDATGTPLSLVTLTNDAGEVIGLALPMPSSD